MELLGSWAKYHINKNAFVFVVGKFIDKFIDFWELQIKTIISAYEHKIEEPVPKVSVPVLELQDRSQIKP